ncbi:murein biosynthesis integral membrane protein MurJ [Microbacterium sp.]|jgi:putative peptidoglycan lipid II flippase|uniref:murein biosynthesis integral membrane protein MurJ n=1 Tax=Microbacterium sp. TaxID=51671 RepID=UPI0037CC023D
MSSLGRASAILGAGTLVSRLTGVVRSIVLVAAVGSVGSGAADAFTIANQLPNNIYAIISTGILTGVLVPQIVRAAKHADGGGAFVSKLLTLGTVVLVVVTGLATLAAPLLVQLYAQFAGEKLALTIALAYWCIPQLFFYGLYALVGETLNARRVFGPYTWAPIVNNIVSIAGFVAFILLFGPERNDVLTWTPDMITLLGGTATLGIAVQAGVLLLFWRRSGLRFRPDFAWRGMGLRTMGTLAWWTFWMVVVGQVAGLVQTRVVSAASDVAASAATMAFAWFIFILPYSVIAVSIGTPYFTQLSEHAAAGRDDEVRADLGASIRTISFFLVGALAAVVAAAVPVSRIFSNSASDAAATALVLGAYLVGLVPLSILYVVQRTFYAYGDTFRPFVFTLVQAVLVVVTALLAGAILPLEYLAAGIALGQSLAGIVQLAIALLLLRGRLGLLGLRAPARALGRFFLAGVPAATGGWVLFLLLGGFEGWTTSSIYLGVAGAALVGGVTLAVYVAILAVMRAPELAVVAPLLRRLRRR